ncbi:36137_t:CDS:1, partial [Racocetra persica]
RHNLNDTLNDFLGHCFSDSEGLMEDVARWRIREHNYTNEGSWITLYERLQMLILSNT